MQVITNTEFVIFQRTIPNCFRNSVILPLGVILMLNLVYFYLSFDISKIYTRNCQKKNQDSLSFELTKSVILLYSQWDRGQIGIKLGKTCYKLKVSKFYVEKRYLC